MYRARDCARGFDEPAKHRELVDRHRSIRKLDIETFFVERLLPEVPIEWDKHDRTPWLFVALDCQKTAPGMGCVSLEPITFICRTEASASHKVKPCDFNIMPSAKKVVVYLV